MKKTLILLTTVIACQSSLAHLPKILPSLPFGIIHTKSVTSFPGSEDLKTEFETCIDERILKDVQIRNHPTVTCTFTTHQSSSTVASWDSDCTIDGVKSKITNSVKLISPKEIEEVTHIQPGNVRTRSIQTHNGPCK